MNKKFKKVLIGFISLLLIFALYGSFIFAHPGRLDSNGGHNDYINGGYHYHDGNSSGSSKSSNSKYYDTTHNSETKNSGFSISSSTMKIIFCFIVAIAVLIVMYIINPLAGIILYAYAPLFIIIAFFSNIFDIYIIDEWQYFFLPIAIFDVFIIIETIIEKIYKHKRK